MFALRPLAAAALLLLAGCGAEPAGGPPEIQYGLEECGFCRMIVSEEKFAAGIFDQAGAATRFDDVGCLLDFLRERSVTPESVWVHDYATGAWIDAEPAFFVRDPRGATPMGSGLVAFAQRTAAEAFASERAAAVATWQELVAQPQAAAR